MKAYRFLLLLAIFALFVGFVSANDAETREQLAMTDLTQILVGQAPACSSTTGRATGLFPPDLCAQCLDACHPRDFVCIQACLNGPCI